MRELTTQEVNAVSGGIGGITGIRMGLGPNPAAAMLTASFYVGYAVGTAIYNTYVRMRY